MRDIEFRAKSKYTNEWVFGSLLVGLNNETSIAHSPRCEKHHGYTQLQTEPIDPDTVGQYTGINDPKGKRIFEGDIYKSKGDIGCIIFEDQSFFTKDWEDWRVHLMYMVDKDFEIIGDIHDNPEFLTLQ